MMMLKPDLFDFAFVPGLVRAVKRIKGDGAPGTMAVQEANE